MNKQKIVSWVLVSLWAGLIFFLSDQPSLPSATVVWWDYIFKKSAHIFVYAVLYFLLVRALSPKNQVGLASINVYVTAFYIAGMYAISDEFHQSFTPGRYPSVLDVGYDLTGVFIVFNLLRYRYGFGSKS